jgi:uncharacterized protein
MLNTRTQVSRKRGFFLSLPDHHARCEMNYHLCMSLFPGCKGDVKHWAFVLDTLQETVVKVELEDQAPYTSTLLLTQTFLAPFYLQAPQLRVRLYHDVGMAEVIAWNRHRHWRPVYQYPNPNMYQPDEKIALNRFLGELLMHCRKLGIAHGSFCESIRINKN